MKPAPPLASIALISAAVLAYEILLMRLLSITQWHHFAYMIISVALLGYGVSGTFLVLARERLRGRFRPAFIANAALFGATSLGGFLMAQKLPFNALEVLWDPRQPLWLILIYLLLFLPFFFAANCICLAFLEYRQALHRIYAVDLLGAGLGGVGIIGLLFIAPPMAALKLVSALGLLTAGVACLETRAARRWPLAGLALAAASVLAVVTPPQLKLSEYKGLSQALRVVGARQLDERSSPLGLLTTVESHTVPFRHAPGMSLNTPAGPPAQLAVFTDGEGMQMITRFDGDLDSLVYLDHVSSALPYHLLEHPRVLVLGAGAGAEVLQALYHGAASIHAVELNPQVVQLADEEFAEFSGRPYSHDQVTVHVGDARGFATGAPGRYDLVQVALLDAFGASAAGLYALSENYLYTVEGLGELIRALRPGGIVAVTRWIKLPPRDGLKLFAIAAAALERAGVAEPGRQIIMIRSWNTSTLLVGNRPFSADQIARLKAFTRERWFDLVHYPGIVESEANRFNALQEPWYFLGAHELLGPGRDRFLDDYKFNIRPATDDAPYFNQFLKWRSIPEILALKGQGGLPLLEQGYLVLVLTLAQAVLISLALILLPLWLGRTGSGAVGRGRWRVFSYFFAIGLAFMLIEIAYIQKFILFLHHPLYAVAAVLCAFLVFAGLGSALSPRWGARGSVAWPVAGIVLAALLYLLALPPLFAWLIPLPQTAKVAVSVALIAPLAFLMGMPFPLGLTRLAGHAEALIPWAWGINGCASVISAILATLLAIHAGFAAVVATACALYVLAAAVFGNARPGQGLSEVNSG